MTKTSPVVRLILTGCMAAAMVCAQAAPAHAVVIYFSTRIPDVIGGVEFDGEDIVQYDTDTGVATIFFDGSDFFDHPGRANIDAFYLFPGGEILLSTTRNASIDGFHFQDEDLVLLNPVTRDISLFLDGSTVFKSNNDIKAVDILPDGRIILAAETDEILGVAFESRDLIALDPTLTSASLFFDGDAHFETKRGSIHALDVEIVPPNRLGVATGDANAKLGGQLFQREDIVFYDPVTKQFELFFDGSAILERTTLTHDKGIDALHVPDLPFIPT